MKSKVKMSLKDKEEKRIKEEKQNAAIIELCIDIIVSDVLKKIYEQNKSNNGKD
jgi:hypothetical protein